MNPEMSELVLQEIVSEQKETNLINGQMAAYIIDQRVLAGEHYVRPDVVEERYVNSLHLLNHYFKIPDHIQLFDNSKSLQLCIEARRGEILRLENPLPAWVQNHLTEHVTQNKKVAEKKTIDMNSIDEVRKSYQVFKEKADQLLSEVKKSPQEEIKKTESKKQGKKPGL